MELIGPPYEWDDGLSKSEIEGKEKIDGLFIPCESVRLTVAKLKRKEQFLAIYPEIVDQLSPESIHTFLVLLSQADYRNRLTLSFSSLAKLFKPLCEKTVKHRMKRIKAEKGVKGRLPLIFLNPYFGSKCSTGLLKTIRYEWQETED